MERIVGLGAILLLSTAQIGCQSVACPADLLGSCDACDRPHVAALVRDYNPCRQGCGPWNGPTTFAESCPTCPGGGSVVQSSRPIITPFDVRPAAVDAFGASPATDPAAHGWVENRAAPPTLAAGRGGAAATHVEPRVEPAGPLVPVERLDTDRSTVGGTSTAPRPPRAPQATRASTVWGQDKSLPRDSASSAPSDRVLPQPPIPLYPRTGE